MYQIIDFLAVILITAGTFLLTKYIFLEYGMEEKKQRIFYAISFGIIIITFFAFGEDIAQLASLLLGGLNIFIGRKKHRPLGFLLILPLVGIMNGIFSPIIVIQMLVENESTMILLSFGLYLLFAAALLVFYLKGKEWRKWFRKNMKNRRPLMSEYAVIFIAGFLLFAGSYTIDTVCQNHVTTGIEAHVKAIIALYESCAFLLTLTIVILIMQGNKRKFYHDGVSNMQFNVIATMADIVENRDSNTGGHIKRTAKYVEIIGKELKKKNLFNDVLTEQYLNDMIVAAPLHDIGKISVPDAILNKPGKLTDEEFAIMKNHAAAGREVLQKAEKQLGEFSYLDVALNMAGYHHEWWNGKGYPNGISEDEIPLCARIMAVADVFDALTSARCYKKAMPLDKAYDVIRSESGSHFDPRIAEAFLDSSDEVETAIEEFSDNVE